MLTKKHFRATASILAQVPLFQSQRDLLIRHFGVWFHSENPSFCFGKFEEASKKDAKLFETPKTRLKE